jgi:Ca-activated chloride channel family protein
VAPPTQNRVFVASALRSLRVGQGTALGDGIATSVKVAVATPPGEKRKAGTPPPPTAVLVLSDGAQDGGSVKLSDAVARARKSKVPVFTALLGTAAGVVQVPHVGGYVERIQVPPNPTALRTVAAQTGGSYFAAPTQDDLRPVYADLKSRLGKTKKDEEITVAFAGAGALFLLVAGALSVVWFRRVP